MQGLLPPSSSTAGVRFSAAQHFLADSLAAGEENEIEFLVQQIGVFLASARDDGDIFRRENGGDHLFDDGGRGGRISAGFDQAHVARSDGVDQRLHGEQEGVIPRAHDQRAAKRRG